MYYFRIKQLRQSIIFLMIYFTTLVMKICYFAIVPWFIPNASQCILSASPVQLQCIPRAFTEHSQSIYLTVHRALLSKLSQLIPFLVLDTIEPTIIIRLGIRLINNQNFGLIEEILIFPVRNSIGFTGSPSIQNRVNWEIPANPRFVIVIKLEQKSSFKIEICENLKSIKFWNIINSVKHKITVTPTKLSTSIHKNPKNGLIGPIKMLQALIILAENASKSMKIPVKDKILFFKDLFLGSPP